MEDRRRQLRSRGAAACCEPTILHQYFRMWEAISFCNSFCDSVALIACRFRSVACSRKQAEFRKGERTFA